MQRQSCGPVCGGGFYSPCFSLFSASLLTWTFVRLLCIVGFSTVALAFFLLRLWLATFFRKKHVMCMFRPGVRRTEEGCRANSLWT